MQWLIQKKKCGAFSCNVKLCSWCFVNFERPQTAALGNYMLSDATFDLFTPCDILDVTRTQKQISDSVWVWPLWVQVNCTLTLSLDNVYLLVDDSTFASTNNKYLEDSRANRRDLQRSAAPALQWTFDSADQFHDLMQVLADLFSSFFFLSESNRKKNRRKNCSTAASQSGCVHLGSIERARYATKHLRDTDSDYVMKKPSRCWLGAVPRYWKVVASCFQIVVMLKTPLLP